MRFKSVVLGRDKDVIPLILKIHCNVETPKILDVTYNTGKMWKETHYNPIKLDIDGQLNCIDICGDFTKLPFIDNIFDVIVFDPPHLPINAASELSSNIYKTQYGITNNDIHRSGDNISPLFHPFLQEAKRVLKHNGIILAKLIDMVHNHRYQWQHIDYINTVKTLNMTPCDLVIKVDPAAGNLISSKWKSVKHFHRQHTYWIVVRNSTKCEISKVDTGRN